MDDSAANKMMDELEVRVKASVSAGDLAGACSTVVRGFGPEICGFIASLARAESVTEDAYSRFCEDLWRGLPSFKWHGRLRSWLYALARNAYFRVKRDDKRARLHPNGGDFAELEAEVRSQTALHFSTEVKDAVRDLRYELVEEDQELLILRVDRGMSWQEIAQVRREADSSDADLKREAAKCRKRFERIKARIKELAMARGLLAPKG